MKEKSIYKYLGSGSGVKFSSRWQSSSSVTQPLTPSALQAERRPVLHKTGRRPGTQSGKWDLSTCAAKFMMVQAHVENKSWQLPSVPLFLEIYSNMQQTSPGQTKTAQASAQRNQQTKIHLDIFPQSRDSWVAFLHFCFQVCSRGWEIGTNTSQLRAGCFSIQVTFTNPFFASQQHVI